MSVDPKKDQKLQDFAARLPDALASKDTSIKAVPNSYIQEKQKADIEAANRQRIKMRDEQQDVGFWGAFGVAGKTTTTYRLYESGLARLLEDSDEDPAFKASWNAEAYGQILHEYDLQSSEHTLKRLSSATNNEQLVRMAQEIKEQQRNERLLEGHGFQYFAANMLDPVENAAMAAAAIGATTLSGPVAGLSVAGARFARVAHASAVTGAGLGAMYAGAEAGVDYTLADYVVTTAVGGLLSYKTAPKAPSLIKPKEKAPVDTPAPQKEATTSPREETKVRESAPVPEKPTATPLDEVPTKEATVKERTKVGEGAPSITRAEMEAAFRKEVTPKAGQRLTRGLEKALKVEIADLKYKLQIAADAVPTKAKELIADYARKGMPARRAKQQADKAAKVETAESIEVLQERLAIAEKKLADSLEAKKAQGQLDTLDSQGRLPEEWESRIGVKKPHTEAEEVLQEAIGAAEAVSAKAKPDDVTPTALGAAGAAPEPTVQAQAAPTAPKAQAAPTDTSLEDQVNTVLSNQAGMKQVDPNMLKRGFRFFRELVSEYDKITGRIPAIEKFVSKVLDDPLRRNGLMYDNAASVLRQNTLLSNGEMRVWEDTLDDATRAITGEGKLKAYYSTKHLDTRTALEDAVYREMLQRNHAAMSGRAVTPPSDPTMAKLIDVLEETIHKSAERAKEQGLAGMENYTRTPGYVPRNWSYDKIDVINRENPILHTKGQFKGQPIKNGASLAIIELAAMKGMPDITKAEARAIAHAIVDRTTDKATNARTDAMGQLGKLETSHLIERLEANGVDQTLIDSIKLRLENVLQDKTGVKYVKDRIPLDMTVVWNPPNGGRPISMADLVDTDVSRLTENYQHAMAGRGALAHVGIGGDDAGIQTWLQKYYAELNAQNLPNSRKEEMFKQMEHTIGEYTGIRPDSAVLSPAMSVMKSLATAVMMGGMGVLQVGEASVIIARHGAMSSMRHMLQRAPGIGKLMQEIGSDPKLYQEFETVTNLRFTNDTRMRTWKRQTEIGLIQDSNVQRLAYLQQQLVPTLTGQRYVHRLQTEILLNINMHTLYKAATGDKEALKLVKQYGNLTDAHLERIKESAVVSEKGTLKELGLGKLSDGELNQVKDTLTRMQDSLLLASRPGYGTSYGHTAVGQLLGQFTNYVGLAHNITLRGTAQHEGSVGVAKILAYQYPVMLMVTYMNEARKGNVLDLGNDEDLKELAAKAFTMSSVLGMYGDVVNTVMGNNGRGIAATGILETPGNITSTLGNLAKGEFGAAGSDAVKTVRGATVLGVFPGSQLLEKGLKEDL